MEDVSLEPAMQLTVYHPTVGPFTESITRASGAVSVTARHLAVSCDRIVGYPTFERGFASFQLTSVRGRVVNQLPLKIKLQIQI